MNCTIPYGEKQLTFEIPDKNFHQLLTPRAVQACPDVGREIRDALERPIGGPPISELVQAAHRVNIICDDLTRPTPVRLILPVVIEKLRERGVSEKNIKIIIALGSHRYMTESELRERVGDAVYDRFGVYNSEYKNKEDLALLGKAADGTDIWASKIAMDSDIRIGVGNIVPHPSLGWGGGAKILYPGIAGEDTVTRFHMEDVFIPENRFGKVDNPVRRLVESWADTIGLHFIVNTILNKDFEIYRVVAGDYIQAHRQGVEYAKEVYGRKMESLADAVVVSSHPADTDYWQSGKAITASENAIKKHGTVVHVSPNYEGVGPHEDRFKYACMDDPMQKLRDVLEGRDTVEEVMSLSSGVSTKMRAQRIRLITVTDGITEEMLGAFSRKFTRLHASGELQQVIDGLIREQPDIRIAVITHGAEIVPYVD